MSYLPKPTITIAFETTTPLGAGATYTSPVVVLSGDGYSQVQTEVLADTDGSMTFTFYADDAGTDVIRTLVIPYTAADGYRQFGAPTFGRAVRYAFTDGGAGQTDFYFTTKVLTGAVSPQILAVDGFITSSMMTTVQRSIVVGADTQGNYRNVGIDADDNLKVSIQQPAEAFGAIIVSDLHPVIQRKFVQGLSAQQDETVDHDGGTVTANSQGELELATSTTTSSAAIYRSKKIIGYRPGQAVVARFTARFTTGVAGTEQIIGAGDAEDGLFFGYDGSTFGVMRRTGGQVETRTLTVTAAASGAGNVTVTLNGGAVVTALAGTETIGEAAAKIAASDYSTAGGGWIARYAGNQVVFQAIDTATRGGAYSFVDTGGTGVTATGPTQTLAASAATDTWIPQTSWNLDPADGTGTLPVLDQTKGNVFEIQYQWLGYGAVLFRVEDPVTGRFVNVHRIQYANANTAPTLRQPDLPLYAVVDNGATVSNIVMRSASLGGFYAGEPGDATEVRFSADNSKSTDTTRVNILVLRVVTTQSGVTNRKRVRLDEMSLGNNSSNRTSQVHATLNPSLVGAPSWTAVDAGGDSIVEYDVATTDIVAGSGRRVGTFTVGAAGGSDLHLEPHNEIVLEPGDILVVSMALASGGTSATQVAALGWSETV